MVNGLLAQLVEQVTLNHRVVGSIPTQPTQYERVYSVILCNSVPLPNLSNTLSNTHSDLSQVSAIGKGGRG